MALASAEPFATTRFANQGHEKIRSTRTDMNARLLKAWAVIRIAAWFSSLGSLRAVAQEFRAPDGGVISREAIARRIEVEGTASFSNILFKLDSTELAGPNSQKQIAEIGAALASGNLRDVSFTLEGHTCDLGSAEHNQALSQRRAEAVRSILIQNYHAKPERIKAVGKGESEPAVPNTSESNRALNRRVVLKRN